MGKWWARAWGTYIYVEVMVVYYMSLKLIAVNITKDSSLCINIFWTIQHHHGDLDVDKDDQWQGFSSGKSFSNYSGLWTLQLDSKLWCSCNNCNLIGICLQFQLDGWYKMSWVKFHLVTCWFISGFLIIFSQVLLLCFSQSNHHLPSAASYFLPATALYSLQHSSVMWTQCCLFTACKPSSPHCLQHALVQALFSCQSVAVSELRRWWLGTGGTLYKCVWEGGLPVKQWAVGCYKLHTVLVWIYYGSFSFYFVTRI